MHSRAAKCALIAIACFLSPQSATAQSWAQWLNGRIDSVVATRLQLRDPTKLPLLPAGSASEASLVDRSAMPDVVGISVALPGQPDSDGLTPASFSSSLYLFWTLLKGQGLLDPGFYNRSGLARRIGLNLAFDRDDSTGLTTTQFQAKIKVLDRGPLFGDNAPTGQVRSALERAADAYGRLDSTVVVTLYEAIGTKRGQTRLQFLNSLNEPQSRDAALDEAGAGVRRAIDKTIEQFVGSFVALTETMSRVVEQSRSRPEASIGVTFRDEPESGSETRIVGILDLLARRSLDFTLNSGVEIVDVAGSDDRVRFEIATQLLFLLSPDNRFDGKAPMSLALAGSGRFAKDEAGTWRAQARLLLPLTDGINVPISATWASRSDLIDEGHVLGQVGFSFDTIQMIAALR
jgi:hypothetical protein